MDDKEKAEKKRIYDKKYREENEKKIKEYNKKYAQSEKGKERKQKYSQSEKGKKTDRISVWKQRKVICDDWDALHEYYKNCWECENCGVELIEGLYGNNKKCLDHCHITGKFRNVLCHYCNVLRDD